MWFADFGYMGSKAAAYKGEYTYVSKSKALVDALTKQLDDHNRQANKRPLSLVMFNSSVQNVLRVARVLRQTRGHALLVGPSGSGRRALTRMAAFLEGMETVEADNSMRSNIEEWRRTLVGMLRRAGVSQERITFFFADSFIQANNAVHQQMLEDVCNLVTHGIIPNLFSADELVDMHEQLLAPAKRAGGRWADSKASLLEFFMHSCNHNLRIVVSVTSVTSDTVRSRLLACPALTQACCMMWLQPWGDEGLKAIAERFVADIPMEPQLKQSVVLCCVRIHILAQKVSQESSAKTGISTVVYLIHPNTVMLCMLCENTCSFLDGAV